MCEHKRSLVVNEDIASYLCQSSKSAQGGLFSLAKQNPINQIYSGENYYFGDEIISIPLGYLEAVKEDGYDRYCLSDREIKIPNDVHQALILAQNAFRTVGVNPSISSIIRFGIWIRSGGILMSEDNLFDLRAGWQPTIGWFAAVHKDYSPLLERYFSHPPQHDPNANYMRDAEMRTIKGYKNEALIKSISKQGFNSVLSNGHKDVVGMKLMQHVVLHVWRASTELSHDVSILKPVLSENFNLLI